MVKRIAAKQGTARVTKRPRSCKLEAGIAFVQFALLLPLLMVFLLRAWDVLLTINAQIRQRSAAIQMAVNFQTTPLRAYIDQSAAIPEIEIKRLDDISPSKSELKDYLDSFNSMFNDAMLNSGTAAEHFRSNIMLRLVYFCIQSPSDAPLPGCEPGPADPNHPEGTPYSYIIADAGNSDYHTAPGPNDNANECFGNEATVLNQYKAGFDSFVTEKINYIMTNNSTMPFGTLTIDLDSSLPLIGTIKSYTGYRPLLFYRVCTEIPAFFSSEPVMYDGFIFADKEVGFQ